jgi:hypothetical protein
MADVKYVSTISDDYDTQLAALARRQKYAELLAKQGSEPIDVETVNGIPTPISPFQGLAKVMQSGMGAYLGRKAEADAGALKKSERSQLIENLKNYETAPGDTISMPEQSISANMPATPRATFDRTTGTFAPGADTQTTPTNINIPKYELAAAPRPRTLTEKGDLALQYAQGGSPETSAMWTGRYADVAKKQQQLTNLVPQAKAALTNAATPKNLLPGIQTALDLQDVEGLSAVLKLAQEKGTPSAPKPSDLKTAINELAELKAKNPKDPLIPAYEAKINETATRLRMEQQRINLEGARLKQDNYAPPTTIGFTGPDGEEKQIAAIFDKKRGGYIDASTMQPIVNPKNLRVIGNSTGAGRTAGMAGRVVVSALDAASDISNMSAINADGTMGIFGAMGNTPLSALKRSITEQESQDMQATMSGLSRAMALLGSGGLASSDTVMKSFDQLQPQTGNSLLTSMRKLGSFRQQAVNGINAAISSPMYSPEQKVLLKKAKGEIETAIPWLPKDVQNLENSGKSGTSMRDVFTAKLGQNAHPNGTAPKGWTQDLWDYASPEQIARYKKP